MSKEEMVMDPIALMVAEHRVIEKVLTVLAARTAAIEAEPTGRDEAADRAFLADCVTFVRGYADALHHGKEEEILFAVLKRHGLPPDLGPPLAAICREHETARLLTGDLASMAKKQSWTAADLKTIQRVAREYTSLLRRHIATEDQDVFPACAKALGRRGMADVEKACERFEKAQAQKRAELEALAAKLCG
jgi:hemerythrin-like domain-containing protein